MTVFIDEPCVTITEVAKRTNLTVDEVKAECAALNMFIGVDWKHEEALSTRDAYVLVDGSARRNLEHQNAFQAHLAALQQWQTDHESVRREAWQTANDEALRSGVGAPVAAERGHTAAREAVAEFERANPEPVFAEPESRIQGWLRKVKAGTR
jgi:hypothetical protein